MSTAGQTHRQGPLSGIRVLDCSRTLSGPYASMVLADFGAEVIKVEPIEKGDETRNFSTLQGVSEPLLHRVEPQQEEPHTRPQI